MRPLKEIKADAEKTSVGLRCFIEVSVSEKEFSVYNRKTPITKANLFVFAQKVQRNIEEHLETLTPCPYEGVYLEHDNARTDVPEMVAEIERLEKEHTRIGALLDEANFAILDLCAEITELKGE